jgi:hypothetical protein
MSLGHWEHLLVRSTRVFIGRTGNWFLPTRAISSYLTDRKLGRDELYLVLEARLGRDELRLVLDTRLGRDELRLVLDTRLGRDELRLVLDTRLGRDELRLVLDAPRPPRSFPRTQQNSGTL